MVRSLGQQASEEPPPPGSVSAFHLHQEVGFNKPGPLSAACALRPVEGVPPGTRVVVVHRPDKEGFSRLTVIPTAGVRDTYLVVLTLSGDSYCYCVLNDCESHQRLWAWPVSGTTGPSKNSTTTYTSAQQQQQQNTSQQRNTLVSRVADDDTVYVTDFALDPNWRGTQQEGKQLAESLYETYNLGSSMVRSRSYTSKLTQKSVVQNFTIVCARQGNFKSKATKGIKASTKSTGCKSQIVFRLSKDSEEKEQGLFLVDMKNSCSNHNHNESTSLQGFSKFTRLNDFERSVIEMESKGGGGRTCSYSCEVAIK